MDEATEKTIAGCSVLLIDLVGQPHCQEPETSTYVSGCVGEHLDEHTFCTRHAALLRDGHLLCVECWRAGSRVSVALLAEVLPSGERVRVLDGTAS